ncbi:hypothetical protein CRX62_12010 [Klebsiella pneumoniae]|nr:hypothetical protein CRX62_12010 [Klebsiella pneumoniae]
MCLGAHNRCHLQMMSGYPGSRLASRGFWNAAFYPLPPGGRDGMRGSPLSSPYFSSSLTLLSPYPAGTASIW